jgi:hypothetical protein
VASADVGRIADVVKDSLRLEWTSREPFCACALETRHRGPSSWRCCANVADGHVACDVMCFIFEVRVVVGGRTQKKGKLLKIKLLQRIYRRTTKICKLNTKGTRE